MKQLFIIISVAIISTFIHAQDNGSVGLNDTLYPQLGNGGYDVQHYAIDLTFSPDENFIDGTTTIDAIALQDLRSFNLDLSGLDVATIRVNGTDATFSREQTKLTVIPIDGLVEGDLFTISVTYSGVPEPVNDKGVPFIQLGWQEFESGYFASVSEPSGSMNWFPSNNHPTDKATFTFQITVPQPNSVAANGVLSDVIENDNNSRTYIWNMTDSMATYLAIVAIGDYVEFTDNSGSVLLRSYFPEGIQQQIVDAHHDALQEMMSYLSDLLGDYPFEVYGVVAVPGFPAALETQTLSIFSITAPSEEVVLHELLHQWIGDSVSVADWQDIWLLEGTATYFEILWLEHKEGKNAYMNQIKGFHSFAVNSQLPAPALPKLEDLFGASVYVRGALAYHALRVEVGDDKFFEILRTFYQTYAYGNATTEDFIAVAESVSGKDLASFFDGWLMDDIIPDLNE